MGGNVSSRIGYYLSVVAPFYPPVIVRSIVIYHSPPVLIPGLPYGALSAFARDCSEVRQAQLVKAREGHACRPMSWERNPAPIVFRKALVRHDDDSLQASPHRVLRPLDS